jgi:ABC-2 type transport system permease protein
MSAGAVRALARFEWKVTSSEPANVILPLMTPLVFLAFLVPSMGAAAEAGGYGDASGAALTIPFVAVLFGFYTVNNVALAFFREHGWNTWDRLRTVGLSRSIVTAGKLAVPAGVAAAQAAVLLIVGQLAFDVDVAGHAPAVAIAVVPTVLMPLGLGLFVASITPSMPSANAAGVLLLMVLIGLGGGFAPTDLLPGWSQALASISPTRWVGRCRAPTARA